MSDPKRTIRVGVPMDAALFAELTTMIVDRWPGTTVANGNLAFVFTLPEEHADEGKGPTSTYVGPTVIHDGELESLPRDEDLLWDSARGLCIRWVAHKELWHIWTAHGSEEGAERPRFHDWVDDAGLAIALTPNQYPLRLVKE